MRTRFCVITTLVLLCGVVHGQNNPVPFVNQPLVPHCAKPGGVGFTLTVYGTGFAKGAVVDWNGKGRSTKFVSQSELKAKILASDITHAQTAAVTVVNPKPGGGRSNVGNFEVVEPHRLAFHSKQFNLSSGDETLYYPTTGDFTGDGKLDLIGQTVTESDIMVELNKGNGKFGRPILTQIEPAGLGTGVTGDFNEDGILDFAIINDSNSVALFLGRGNGKFRAQRSFLTGINPAWLVAGDFNGDGHLDLATINNYDNTISVLLGNGDGTFKTHIDSQTSTGPYSMALGDFNQDGKLDLAILGDRPGLAIMLGNGDGTFTQDYNTSTFFYDVVAEDMNHDGKLDLVGSNGLALFILPGKGNGSFGTPRTVWSTGNNNYNIYDVVVADVAGTGALDLVTFETQGYGTPPTYLTVVNATNGHAFQYQVDTGGSEMVADFNNDGRPDVLALGYSSNSGDYWNEAYIQTSAHPQTRTKH